MTIYHGDARSVLDDGWGAGECVVIDPPWDDRELVAWASVAGGCEYESRLVFTDGRRFGDTVQIFGSPSWPFVWDCMNTWSRSPRQPVQQVKYCLWYDGTAGYNRDGALWGEAPPARNHPTTKQTPLAGRRLTDLYRESIRWLHNPTAGASSVGTERFAKSHGNHEKPLAWMRCLIGNTSGGDVIDPFMGTGTSLVAAKQLGRRAIGVEVDERLCEIAVRRLAQGTLFGGRS